MTEVRGQSGPPPGAAAGGDGRPHAAGPIDPEGRFPPRMERLARYAVWVGGTAWMVALLLIWTSNPGLHHGDTFSDANVLNAGRNFDAWGLGLNCGLPTHDGTPAPGHPVRPYTRYPPGPEWVHAGLKSLSLRELGSFRAAALAVTAVALWCAWRVFARLSGSEVVAALAVFFYSWSAPFSQYADSLHQHAYMQLTLFGCLGAWLAYTHARPGPARLLCLAGACLAFFADLWLTFEHILFIPLFGALHLVLTRAWSRRRGLLALTAVPAVVLGLRLAHNSLALGGFDAAFEDLFAAARHRAGFSAGDAGLRALLETWSARLGGRPASEYDAEFAYPFLVPGVGLPALLLVTVLLTTWHLAAQRATRRAFGHAVALVAAGSAWWLAMPNHAAHRHVIMLLLPGLSLLLAALVAAGLRLCWTPPPRAPHAWLGAGLALALTFAFGWHMRSSLTLNQVFKLDARARALVERRRAAETVLQSAGAALRGETGRVWFVANPQPETAYHFGLPYEFHRGRTLPVVDAGDVVVVDYWSDAEKRFAWDALERYGLPEMLAAPCDVTLVFRARGTGWERPDVAYENGLRLTGLRCAPTLDGQASLVQALLELPAEPPLRPDLLVHVVEVLDADGNVLARNELGLQWALRHQQTLLAVHRLRSSDLRSPARLRLRTWSSEWQRFLRTPEGDGIVRACP